jgi:hypothetical protein
MVHDAADRFVVVFDDERAVANGRDAAGATGAAAGD